MRNARIANRSISLPAGRTRSGGAQPGPVRRWQASARCGPSVRFDAQRETWTDRWLPVIENALTAAGYLVLTAGAVVLLFRFAP